MRNIAGKFQIHQSRPQFLVRQSVAEVKLLSWRVKPRGGRNMTAGSKPFGVVAEAAGFVRRIKAIVR